MNTGNGPSISGHRALGYRTHAESTSFIQVVQDDGDWFEPHDVVRLVIKSQKTAAGRLIKAKRGQYEVVACAPAVSGQGRFLEVSLREIRRG